MIQMTEQQLREFGRQCAAEALAAAGLDDQDALRDMRELRSFISSWRLAKREIFRNVVGGVAKVFTAAFVLGMAFLAGSKIGGFH
jgi:hypothetical protein